MPNPIAPWIVAPTIVATAARHTACDVKRPWAAGAIPASRTAARPYTVARDPPVLRPHVRLPDERARLGTLAALLVAEGMEPATDLEDADVVVLNTCCIRENADNKLYGHLGHLKTLKDERPDLQIAVGGCLAQKDRDLVREKAPHVDVVFGTHNLAHAPGLLERARVDGPIVEILEEHEAYPSALPARREVDHSAWVTIQIGCDNSCAFCIVPAVRGREVSRRMGDIVHEVEQLAADGVSEITLLGQNVNSLRPRPRRRAVPAARSPTCCARSMRSTASTASGSRRRTRRTYGPRRSRRWPSARRCASTCTCRCSPAATARSRACTAATRPTRYLARLASRAGRNRRPRSHDRHHRRLPRRDRGRLRPYARSRRRRCVRRCVHVRVLAPTRHRSRGDGRRLRRPPRWCRNACSAWSKSSSATRSTTHTRRASAPSKRCSSTARRRRMPRCGRAAAATTSSCTSPRPRPMALRPGDVVSVRVTAAAPHWLRGDYGERRPAGTARSRPHSRRRSRLRDASSRTRRPDRHRASRRSRWRSRAAMGDIEIVSLDSMQVYRGMDIGTAKPTRRRNGRGPAPSRRRRRPVGGVVGRADPGARARRDRQASKREASARCSSVAPASTCKQSSTGSTLPGEHLPTRAALLAATDDDRRPRGRVRALAYARSRGRGPHRARQPAPDRARARGDRNVGPAVLVVRPRHPTRTVRRCARRHARRVLAFPARCSPNGSRSGSRRCAPAACSTRSRALAARPAGIAAHGRAGDRLPRDARVLATVSIPTLDAAFDLAVRRTRQFARRQRMWFRRDPRIQLGGGREIADASPRRSWQPGRVPSPRRRPDHTFDRTSPMLFPRQAPRHRQRLPRAARARRRGPRSMPSPPRRCATGIAVSVPTASSRSVPAATAPTAR